MVKPVESFPLFCPILKKYPTLSIMDVALIGLIYTRGPFTALAEAAAALNTGRTEITVSLKRLARAGLVIGDNGQNNRLSELALKLIGVEESVNANH